jgi:hypothetical protein
MICFVFISCASTLDEMSSDEMRQIIGNAQEIKIDSIQTINFATRIQERFANYEYSSMPYDSSKDDAYNFAYRAPMGVIAWRNKEPKSMNLVLYSFDQKDSCTIYSGVLVKGDSKLTLSSITILPIGKYLLKGDSMQEVIISHK